MSIINVSDINKEEFHQKKNEKQKDKDKDKEKETSNLLEENQLPKNEFNKESFCQIEKNNEIFYFLVLAGFIFIIYYITRVKQNYINKNDYQNPFIHIIETNDTINNFENRYKHLYPTLTLKKEYTSLPEIMNAKILYIHETNLTNRYLRHVRPVVEDIEEEKYQHILYDHVIPNDTFDEKRENLYTIDRFMDLCNQGKLLNFESLNKTELSLTNPTISIIVAVYNKKNEILKSVRSIQNQSFKNIEIILVDDFSTDNSTNIYNSLLAEDPRIRVFYHLKNMGVFRTRLDGFLYSRGKYILHFDAGDLFSDNLVLEDIYNLIVKYNLDSIRFSFKTYKILGDNKYGISTYIYPAKKIKIRYGKVHDNVHFFGYGTIWNRLIRANVVTKGLDNIDSFILNAYKNLWEDVWWNILVNYVIFGHTTINRVGYIYFKSDDGEGNIKIGTEKERDNTIKEFINFWLFDYQLLPKDDKKKNIIENLRKYSLPNNTFYGTPVNLNYLNTNFTTYSHLLVTLINDYFVDEQDKNFVGGLLNNYTIKFMNNITYYDMINNTLNNSFIP